jgi:hypothetical protein
MRYLFIWSKFYHPLKGTIRISKHPLFHIQITSPLLINANQQPNITAISGLMRQLVNGKRKINNTTNRQWFNSNFSGGFYQLSVNQKSPNNLIEIHYDVFALITPNRIHEYNWAAGIIGESQS